MLSVNRINAQTKITEVWKALKKDKKVTHLKTVHQRSQMKKDNQGQCPKDSLSLMVTQLAQLTISSMMEKKCGITVLKKSLNQRRFIHQNL